MSDVPVGKLVDEACDAALELGRVDLVEDLVERLWLIVRFPAEDFPDGPPKIRRS